MTKCSELQIHPFHFEFLIFKLLLFLFCWTKETKLSSALGTADALQWIGSFPFHSPCALAIPGRDLEGWKTWPLEMTGPRLVYFSYCCWGGKNQVLVCIWDPYIYIYVPGSGSPPHPPCHGHGHNINPPPPCGMGGSWEAVGVIQPTAMQLVG